ncbi:MAG: transposase, partial [Pseudomonadota bacterium]
VSRIKQTTNRRLWRTFPYLKNEFWREKTFWSDGYFVCSVGNAGEEAIRKYIQEQG